MSIALSSLWVVAFILALLGLLPQSPLAMIVSASVLILVAYYSNLLFGWLFNVQTHNESSFITALILFFLFSPSLQLADIAATALVAMIAMASKFVLTIRGRHVFNPAAIAAVTVGLLGVIYASWWIATPTLLPATALFAFLILYKTRRLTLGFIFLAVAITLIVSISVINGQSLLSAIAFLPSWPLLFLVGFMLSEPLTLPPRQWQQFLVGALVAILFAVPVHIGWISSTPALALAIGNIVAFLFTQRQQLQLSFKERRRLTVNSYEYLFESAKPINFTAGQYMEITVPHAHKDGRGIRRIFSIASAPGDSQVRFGVKMYDKSSTFKTTLKSLQKGAIVNATSVGGDFVLPKQADTPLLFVAGGIGITPFISHLLDLKKQNQSRDIVLFYTVSNVDDIAYTDILKESGIRVVVVTKSHEKLAAPDWTHYNARYISKQGILTHVKDITERIAYVSGPPEMVDVTKNILKQLGVKRVTCDYFTGY
jgi:ferredoxin-NADP reductase